MHRWLITTSLAFITILPSRAADWPQWRGPNRDGISTETGWLASWPAGKSPRVAWTARVGKGHSCVVVASGRAFTMGWDGSNDTLFCFDAKTGKLLWKQSYPCKSILQWPGPRATPTVDGDVVYTLGQHGQLHAWSVKDGKSVWRLQLPASYNPDVDYGFAWSPLVEGDLLILAAGSKGLAIHKKNGTFAWGNDGLHGACASAVPYTLAGKRGVALILTNKGRDSATLLGIDPRTAEQHWRHSPWNEKWGAICVDLLVAEGKVFVTSAEQHQRCARFTIDGSKLKLDWENNRLSCYTGGCVLVGGHIYGVNKVGALKCLDWKTGAERWSRRGFGGFGSLMASDDKLILQTSDRGDIVVAQANAAAYKELRRMKVFTGEVNTFTAPVLANGRLYCRSYAGEVVCLDLSGGR